MSVVNGPESVRAVGTQRLDLAAVYPSRSPYTSSLCSPCQGGVPALGKHTEEVLASLGYSASEIEHLRAGDAI